MVNANDHEINLEHMLHEDRYDMFMHCNRCGNETPKVEIKRVELNKKTGDTVYEVSSKKGNNALKVDGSMKNSGTIIPEPIEKYWWGFFLRNPCR